MFPSPLGVSYFQMGIEHCVVDIGNTVFPSPLGVSYFQIIKGKGNEDTKESFRPLSGYLISKWRNRPFSITLVLFPSPLGVSYFQIRGCAQGMATAMYSFPSPLGVSYFQIGNIVEVSLKNLTCFRPLSEYLISKYLRKNVMK